MKIAAGVLILIGVARIVATYTVFTQVVDEPFHVAAGLQFITQGRYILDMEHPPLSRIAVGVPLRLAGLELPPRPNDYDTRDRRLLSSDGIGTRILQQNGRYFRNLASRAPVFFRSLF